LQRKVNSHVERGKPLAEKLANAIEAGNKLKNQKYEIAKQTQLIQLAQHLGKNDFLEKYFANLASSGD
jgi:ferritin-like metal-binding protein YciE